MHVEAKGTSRATSEAVWSLIAEAGTYAKWGLGIPRSRFERILEIEEPRHLVSTVIRGIPVRDYRAEVTLTPTAEDTRIRWAATWGKTLVGRIVRRKLRSFYPDMMALLVAAADRDA